MGFSRRDRIAWALAGVVVVLSLVQTVGVLGGSTSLQSLPSLFVDIAPVVGATVALLLAAILTLGWLGQGIATLLVDARRTSVRLGLAVGGFVLLVGAWNIILGITVGGLARPILGFVVMIIGILGTAGVALSISGLPSLSGQDRDQNSGSADRDKFSETVSEPVLDRLEDTLPGAVEHARQATTQNTKAETVLKEVDAAVLREELEKDITRGELTQEITSHYDESYEIVNLPPRFRELGLPPNGKPVHLRNLDSAIRDRLTNENVSLKEIVTMIERVDTHYDTLRDFVSNREQEFDDHLRELQETLEDIKVVCDRLDGALGDRTREFVLEGRHGTVDGIPQLCTRIDEAKTYLHRCQFDEALWTVESIQNDAEALLTAVDFLGGLTGTATGGGTGASIPNRTAELLLDELASVLEESIGRPVSVVDGRVRFGPAPNGLDEEGQGQLASQDTERSSESLRKSGPEVERKDPAAISDEILFLLRELGSAAKDADQRIEFPTGDLPEEIRRPDVLLEVEAFCRRQPDIVENVYLQEGAPPGFLELEFAGVTPSTGITRLRRRFIDQHTDR